MFNAETLLTPIANSSNPCGTEITFSAEIDQITEARREEDASLNQGEWITEVKTAHWPTVIDLCTKLISTKSKDLRFAVWLTEAGAKTYQFAGLTEGYKLIAGLVDQYWEQFYPQVNDPDDYEQRIGNLSWVLSRTVQLVKNIPITEGKNSAYSSIDFEVARKNAAVQDPNQPNASPATSTTPVLATLEAARKKSSRGFYEKLMTEAEACQQALNQLEQSVDAKLGIDGPSFAAAKEALAQVLNTIKRFAQEMGIYSQQNTSAQNSTPETASPSDLPPTNHTPNYGPIQSRADALKQLRHVADFFRRTEPHSPVAYLADKAATWGEMPLHQWLSTVIKDPNSLSHVEELLGLASEKPAPTEE